MHAFGGQDTYFNPIQNRETGLQLGERFELGNEQSTFTYEVQEILTPTKGQLEGIDIYQQPVGGGVAALILCKLDEQGNRTNQNIVFIGQLVEARTN